MKIFLIDSGTKFELSLVASIEISIDTPRQVITSFRGDKSILPVGDKSIRVSLGLFNVDEQGNIPQAEMWSQLGSEKDVTTTQIKNFEELWNAKTEFELELTFDESQRLFEGIYLKKCVLSDFNPIALNDEKFDLKIISRSWHVT